MRQLKTVCVMLFVVLCYFQAQGADKYTDENRPYEFGFTIEGEQHRHEKKDENGIIMGEFGFITADGVYHVTVYATDENGNFKILAMKNIRVKPYPTSPDLGERKGHSLPFPPSHQAPSPHTVVNPERAKQENPTALDIKGNDGHLLPSPPSQQLSTPHTAVNLEQAKQESPTAIDIRGHKEHLLPSPPSQQLATPHTAVYLEQAKPNNPTALDIRGNNGQLFSTPPLVAPKTQQIKPQSNSFAKSCSNCKVPTTTTPAPKSASLPVISTDKYYKEQPQIAGNAQKTSLSYETQQIHSEHENSQIFQQPYQPSSPNSESSLTKFKQGSVSSHSQQNNPSLAQNYPTQAFNANNQQFSQNAPRIQNPLQENRQEGFNVGRKYLQKTQTQQNYQQQSNEEPNLLHQPGVGLNYQEKSKEEQHQPQGPIAGQFNLQGPYTGQNDQPISNSPQSYSTQSVAKIKEFGVSQIRQNYPTANAERNYIQGSYINDNSDVQQNSYQNLPKNPSEISGDRQPKSFKDILQTINPEQHYKSTSTAANSYKSSQPNIAKPVLVAAQMQLVDKNTNIYHKNPGENEGLPKGITKSDMTQLLYTFNYTVGFHGHHEEGYTNGAKVGYYYVTGRNGVRTRVDYVADETGFHPRISQEDLDIQSDDVPKPETEKDEKYGLKGYEFKWLYYPVNSK